MDIEIAAKDVLFFHTFPELLAPGSSAFVSFPTIVASSQETFANVTAVSTSSLHRNGN